MTTKSTTSKTKTPIKHPKNSKNPKLKIGIIIGLIAIAILAIIITIVLILTHRSSESSENTSDDQPAFTEEVDFNQNLTDANGNTFKASYELGTKSNFSARFTDLTCDTESCTNVQDVKLGTKTLTRDKDYEVKSGSVIITILADTLESLKSGQYELTFKITQANGENLTVGVKITITASTSTPKDETTDNSNTPSSSEDKTSENSQKPSTTGQAANQPSTPSKTEQQLCEEKAAPYRVLTISWLTEAEKTQFKEIFAIDPNDPDRIGFEDGDEIAISGSGYSGAKMKWVNGKCQIDLSEADPIGMGGGDWLIPRSDSNLPEEIRSNPNRNAAIWYFRDGSHQTDFVTGDPWGYINSL